MTTSVQVHYRVTSLSLFQFLICFSGKFTATTRSTIWIWILWYVMTSPPFPFLICFTDKFTALTRSTIWKTIVLELFELIPSWNNSSWRRDMACKWEQLGILCKGLRLGINSGKLLLHMKFWTVFLAQQSTISLKLKKFYSDLNWCRYQQTCSECQIS